MVYKNGGREIWSPRRAYAISLQTSDAWIPGQTVLGHSYHSSLPQRLTETREQPEIAQDIRPGRISVFLTIHLSK